MLGLPKPGRRLVTQNLITSAAFALQASKPNWSSIYDLVELIDVYCMYDSAVTLGRQTNALGGSAIGALLLSRFLQMELPEHAVVECVSSAAKGHLLTYLGQSGVDERFDNLLRFAFNGHGVSHGLQYVPDREEEIQLGDMWLRTAPTKQDLLDLLRRENEVARATTFFVRSFLYLAFADVAGLVLVSDANRASLIGSVVSAENGVRAKLLEAIAKAQEVSGGPVDARLVRVSPLAAIVFERAHSDRKRIVTEIRQLREELAPLRKRLRKAEQTIFYGKGDEVRDGLNDWEQVRIELSKSYGDEPHLVRLNTILSFGHNIGDLADEPMKSKNWIDVLLGLPFSVLKRVVSRRPAIELHNVRRDLPGPGRLQAAVLRLFGPDLGPS